MKYIDTTDLPSDPNGSLADLRKSLRMAFNHNRDSADKMELLKTTLEFVLARIDMPEETPAPTKPQPTTADKKSKPVLSREPKANAD